MSACVYFDLLEAVGVELSTVDGVNEVSVRNRPLQIDAVDPLPHVLVWPGEGAERVDSLQWGNPGGPGRVVWLYPVTVVLLTAGNRVVAANLFAYMLLRQQIRDRLFHPLLGGAVTVYDCDTVPETVFDRIAFAKGNFDITMWQLLFRSSEFFSTTATGL